jgi:hypothetical protein
MGVSGQRRAPAALYPGERAPGTHWTGDWVGLRATDCIGTYQENFQALSCIYTIR